jgi:hypothetical protein
MEMYLEVLDSSGVYICKSAVYDFKHGDYICKSDGNVPGGIGCIC